MNLFAMLTAILLHFNTFGRFLSSLQTKYGRIFTTDPANLRSKSKWPLFPTTRSEDSKGQHP